MCEPNHSIVQFSEDDRPRFSQIMGKIVNAGRRIKNWFHVCKMGAGHSGTLAIHGCREFLLGNFNLYEVAWWQRTTHGDGPIKGVGSLEEAAAYADKVSVGSLSIFRRFFEQSVLKSDHPGSYMDRFYYMLNKKGQQDYVGKLKVSGLSLWDRSFSQSQLQSAVNAALGLTRKRKFLVPEWADNDALWTP